MVFERITVRGHQRTATNSEFIYVQQNGAWKCIQAQITPVAPANYPSDATIVRKYVKGRAQ